MRTTSTPHEASRPRPERRSEGGEGGWTTAILFSFRSVNRHHQPQTHRVAHADGARLRGPFASAARSRHQGAAARGRSARAAPSWRGQGEGDEGLLSSVSAAAMTPHRHGPARRPSSSSSSRSSSWGAETAGRRGELSSSSSRCRHKGPHRGAGSRKPAFFLIVKVRRRKK